MLPFLTLWNSCESTSANWPRLKAHCPESPKGSLDDRWLDAAKAAEYLDMSRNTFDKYRYDSKELQGSKVGGKTLFKKSGLRFVREAVESPFKRFSVAPGSLRFFRCSRLGASSRTIFPPLPLSRSGDNSQSTVLQYCCPFRPQLGAFTFKLSDAVRSVAMAVAVPDAFHVGLLS